jgi:hypothetical protein
MTIVLSRIFSGLGIVGGVLTVFAGLRYGFGFSGWADWLVSTYQDLTSLVKQWLAQLLGWTELASNSSSPPDRLTAIWTFTLFGLSISIGTRLKELATGGLARTFADLRYAAGLYVIGVLALVACTVVSAVVAGAIVSILQNVFGITVGEDASSGGNAGLVIVGAITFVSLVVGIYVLVKRSEDQGHDLKLRLASMTILAAFFCILVVLPTTSGAELKITETVDGLFTLVPTVLFLLAVGVPKALGERLVALAAGVVLLVAADALTKFLSVS